MGKLLKNLTLKVKKIKETKRVKSDIKNRSKKFERMMVKTKDR